MPFFFVSSCCGRGLGLALALVVVFVGGELLAKHSSPDFAGQVEIRDVTGLKFRRWRLRSIEPGVDGVEVEVEAAVGVELLGLKALPGHARCEDLLGSAAVEVQLARVDASGRAGPGGSLTRSLATVAQLFPRL